MQPDPLSLAYQDFQFGHLDEAAERCKVVLSRNPEQAEANHLLSAIRFQQCKSEEALILLKRAAASPRATAEMHTHLGAALYNFGQTGEAIAAFERALAINPRYADALNNLRAIYVEQQKTREVSNALGQAAGF